MEFFPLLKLEFDSETLYISGCDFNVDYAGEVWTTLRGLGQIEPITESGDEIPGVNLTLSGVPNEAIIHAQTEQYRNRKVTILWAFFQGDTLVVDSSAWNGFMDTPVITRGKDTCTIQVTCENKMIDWQRPRGRIFNHADQQRFAAGDDFFLGIEDMVEREIILFKGGGYGGGDGSGYPTNSNVEAPTATVAPVAPPPTVSEINDPATPNDPWVNPEI